MVTRAHPPSARHADTSARNVYAYGHPLPTLHSQPAPRPQMCPPQATCSCKREQEASRGWCRGAGRGREPGRGRSRGRRPRAPRPPAVRPHRGCPSGAPWLRAPLRPRPRSPRLGPDPALQVRTRRRRRMWRGPPSLAQLPGRCRKARPPRSPPPRARPRGGDSGRACAHRAPVCGGAGGVRVAGRAWVTARVCPSVRPDPSGVWPGRVRACASESLRVPGQVGSDAGWRGARGLPFMPAEGSACGWARVRLCGIPRPETFPERLTLGAQADLPGCQPAECGARLGGGEIGVETWGSARQSGGTFSERELRVQRPRG